MYHYARQISSHIQVQVLRSQWQDTKGMCISPFNTPPPFSQLLYHHLLCPTAFPSSVFPPDLTCQEASPMPAQELILSFPSPHRSMLSPSLSLISMTTICTLPHSHTPPTFLDQAMWQLKEAPTLAWGCTSTLTLASTWAPWLVPSPLHSKPPLITEPGPWEPTYMHNGKEGLCGGLCLAWHLIWSAIWRCPSHSSICPAQTQWMRNRPHEDAKFPTHLQFSLVLRSSNQVYHCIQLCHVESSIIFILQ